MAGAVKGRLGGAGGGVAVQGTLQAQKGLQLPRKKNFKRNLGPIPHLPPYIRAFTSQPLTPCHGNLGSLHFQTIEGGKDPPGPNIPETAWRPILGLPQQLASSLEKGKGTVAAASWEGGHMAQSKCCSNPKAQGTPGIQRGPLQKWARHPSFQGSHFLP